MISNPNHPASRAFRLLATTLATELGDEHLTDQIESTHADSQAPKRRLRMRR